MRDRVGEVRLGLGEGAVGLWQSNGGTQVGVYEMVLVLRF
jgi:hypothetical protein